MAQILQIQLNFFRKIDIYCEGWDALVGLYHFVNKINYRYRSLNIHIYDLNHKYSSPFLLKRAILYLNRLNNAFVINRFWK